VFLGGLAFLMVAGVTLALTWRSDARLPWHWLGLFGLSQAVSAWLGAWPAAVSDQTAFQVVHLSIRAASWICLLEFGRRGLQCMGHRVPDRRIYIPLFILFALGAASGQLRGLDATCAYALGLPGGLAAGLALWQASRRARPGEEIGLGMAALAFLSYALTAGLVVPKAALFPASWLNDEAFRTATGVPIQLVQAMGALAAMAGMWFYYCGHGSCPDRPGMVGRWSFPVAFLLIFACGWTATGIPQHTAEAGLRTAPTTGTATTTKPVNPAPRAGLELAPVAGEKPRSRRSSLALTMLLMACLGEGLVIGLGYLAQRRAGRRDKSRVSPRRDVRAGLNARGPSPR
jgi:hypothetical protein